MPRCVALFVLALGFGVATAATAVELPSKPRSAATVADMDVAMPVLGMNMTQVEAAYGAPVDRRPAVGEPPISRWIYDHYTVYFEHQFVIHSVLHSR